MNESDIKRIAGQLYDKLKTDDSIQVKKLLDALMEIMSIYSPYISDDESSIKSALRRTWNIAYDALRDYEEYKRKTRK